jgi:DNA-binding NtrC family response regulator
LQDYDWPGIISELRNAIARGVIMSAGAGVILPEHVALPSHAPGVLSGASDRGVVLRFDGRPTLDEIRDRYLALLLETFNGNRKQVAGALGVSERNTYRMLKKLDPGND